MKAASMRATVVLVAGALGLAFAASASPAGALDHQAGSSSVTAVAAGTPAVPWSPSKGHQIKVLKAVLRKMEQTFPKYRRMTPGPQDIFGYRIGDLWKRGIDGYGTAVAVIEGWDDPAIGQVVHSFDQKFGLPDPAIQTVFPAGPLPARCPRGMVKLGGFGSCAAWGSELTLDVIAAHLVAPYAKIVISATPADTEIPDDPASNVAPPEMMKALEYISGHHLANAISISDGNGEATYRHGAGEITAQDPGELAAAAAGIPVTVATGDCAVAMNLPVNGGPCGNYPDTSTWDDSPWVTAVGGSVPDLGPTGKPLGPDPLWPFSSAGYSSVFTRPGYQDGVARITGSPMRSVPDIVMDGQDGTSESAPLFAGVLALAAQLNRANVGPVNPALYQILGPAGARDGITDVVTGNDACRFCKPMLPGFTAASGFDVASGWGTIDASRFVPRLVAATRAERQERRARAQAGAQLRELEHNVQLSSTHTVGNSVYLLAQGFLPGHPVVLGIDGRTITTLTASMLGYVTYMIDPAALKLLPGKHVVTLSSMLITATGTFTSS
jgi:hypothetical protein